MSAAIPEDDILSQLLPTFIQEANEQTESFEQLMLQLEDAPGDPQLLDALFRCAHTVKGSGGIFGLDRLVSFTHHVETLLDLLRGGRLTLTPQLSSLLLESNDEIRQLAREAESRMRHGSAGAATCPRENTASMKLRW